jgi:hypothetical protein
MQRAGTLQDQKAAIGYQGLLVGHKQGLQVCMLLKEQTLAVQLTTRDNCNSHARQVQLQTHAIRTKPSANVSTSSGSSTITG